MPRHIGIVAVSPEGSAGCYRQIARRAAQVAEPERRPLITLHNLPFSTYLEAIHRGDWETVGTMLRWSSETLAAAGVDFCILPDNVAHHAVHFAESKSTVPWLSMVDLVAGRVWTDGRKSVGIVGTKLVTNGSIYQTMLGLRGIRLLAPEPGDCDALDRIIFTELVHGRIEPKSRDRFARAIANLADRGCEGVVVGSTEIPLLLGEGVSKLPIYDPVDLLVEGAMARAMA